MALSSEAKGAAIGIGVAGLIIGLTVALMRSTSSSCPTGGYPNTTGAPCEMGYYYSPGDGGCCLPVPPS